MIQLYSAVGLACLLFQRSTALLVIDSTLASACVYYLATLEWGCGGHYSGDDMYGCLCGNIEWLGSVTTCMVEENNSTHLVNHAMKHIAWRCAEDGGFNYTVNDMYGYYENASAYLEWPTEEDVDNELDHPVRTNTTVYAFYHKSFKDLVFEVEKSQWFGWGLVLYWSAIMFAATLLNVNNKYFGIRLNTNFIKRNLSLPSTFNGIKNNEEIYFLWKFIPLEFPTRIETVVVTVFVLQTMITACVGYSLTLPNAFIDERWYMNVNLISYRTDMMAISLFPIIYLFGARNNPFIPLTGISFSTFTVYHRWTAISMVCLAFVHSILWTVDSIKDGGYAIWFSDSYFQFGVAAITIAWLMIFHSDKWLRDLAYEIFLVLHKLFAIFFIVCMYFHCSISGWLGWIWSMAGIMVFDRIMRLGRIVLSGGLQTTKMIRCENDVIKLILEKPKFVNYSAGSYAFIYFMSPWYYGWQSHPFAVISSPLEDDKNKLIVYFKPKKGITKALLQKLLKAENQELTVRVIVEGPYGNPVNFVKARNNVSRYIGIAGGLGIASIFPSIAHALGNAEPVTTAREKLEDSKAADDSSAVSSSVAVPSTTLSNYKLYWVINNLSNVIWFNKELEWLMQRNCSIEILYTGSDDHEKDSFNELHQVLGTLNVKVTYTKRPKFDVLVEPELVIASKLGQDLEVLACGPSSFNDDLRQSVVQILKANKSAAVNVNYHVESYTW